MTAAAHPPVSNDRYLALTVLVEAIGAAKDRYVMCPVSGTVVSVGYAVDTVVDGNNVMTAGIGATDITGGGTTLTTAVTAGLGVIVNPTALNAVSRGQLLRATTDGGGTVGQVRVTFLIEQY